LAYELRDAGKYPDCSQLLALQENVNCSGSGLSDYFSLPCVVLLSNGSAPNKYPSTLSKNSQSTRTQVRKPIVLGIASWPWRVFSGPAGQVARQRASMSQKGYLQ